MRSMCEVAYSQRVFVFRRPASGFSHLPGSDPNPTRALADTQATDATRTRNAHIHVDIRLHSFDLPFTTRRTRVGHPSAAPRPTVILWRARQDTGRRLLCPSRCRGSFPGCRSRTRGPKSGSDQLCTHSA